MTADKINIVWRDHVAPVYNKNPRNRAYAVNGESRRQLVALWRACRDATADASDAEETFKSAIEQFAAAGVNCLQPSPPNELQPPQMERDPLGNVLPNPFDKSAPDLTGQAILSQRNPKLKAMADRADEIVALWKEDERRRLVAAKAAAERQLEELEK
jgi:hypothetical protein